MKEIHTIFLKETFSNMFILTYRQVEHLKPVAESLVKWRKSQKFHRDKKIT